MTAYVIVSEHKMWEAQNQVSTKSGLRILINLQIQQYVYNIQQKLRVYFL